MKEDDSRNKLEDTEKKKKMDQYRSKALRSKDVNTDIQGRINNSYWSIWQDNVAKIIAICLQNHYVLLGTLLNIGTSIEVVLYDEFLPWNYK